MIAQVNPAGRPFHARLPKGHNQPVIEGVDLPEIMKTVAVHYLEKGLSETRGNKTETAKMLGLPSYQTLTNWLKKYGLE